MMIRNDMKTHEIMNGNNDGNARIDEYCSDSYPLLGLGIGYPFGTSDSRRYHFTG